MSDLVRATLSGHLGMPDGRSVHVTAGDEFPADDPVVVQHRALFEDVVAEAAPVAPKPANPTAPEPAAKAPAKKAVPRKAPGPRGSRG